MGNQHSEYNKVSTGEGMGSPMGINHKESQPTTQSQSVLSEKESKTHCL